MDKHGNIIRNNTYENHFMKNGTMLSNNYYNHQDNNMFRNNNLNKNIGNNFYNENNLKGKLKFI